MGSDSQSMNEPAICEKLRAIRQRLSDTLEAVDEAMVAEGCDIVPPEPPNPV